MRTTVCGTILVASMAGSAATLTAASAADPDPRWTAWLGCWQLLEERGGDADLITGDLIAASGAVVCVTPERDTTGVRLTTTIENQSALEETLVADGTRRPLSDSGCDGWQQAEWSANGLRIYARAQMVCGGSTRELAGFGFIGRDRTWTDVQSVKEGTREWMRVRRYRRASDQARSGLPPGDLARFAAATARQGAALTIEEIKDASAKLPAPTIEAAIIETHASFPLNRRRLVELADAGVPGRVIDLMIATSFPDRFVVEKREPAAGSLMPSDFDWFSTYYDWPYYYAPFGYSLFNRYDTYYYGAPGYIVVDGGSAIDEPQPSGQGRVIDGLGYTRVRSREPVGTARAGDYGGNGGPSGGSSSGGGSVTTSGYSSGGGGGGGRTAVSRPPG